MIKLYFLIVSMIGSFLITYFLIPSNQVLWGLLLVLLIYIALVALVFILFFLFSMFSNKSKKPEKYSKYYRFIFNIVDYIALSAFNVRVKVIGMEKIPEENFLIVTNHLSKCDAMIANRVFKKRKLILGAKEELFNIPMVGKTIHGVGTLKFSRDNLRADALEIKRGMKWMQEQDCSVSINIEGTRNKDYPNTLLLPFKHACFSMAMKANKPIVLSVVVGTETVHVHTFTTIHKVNYEIVEVITPEQYEGKTSDQVAAYAYDKMLEAIKKYQ